MPLPKRLNCTFRISRIAWSPYWIEVKHIHTTTCTTFSHMNGTLRFSAAYCCRGSASFLSNPMEFACEAVICGSKRSIFAGFEFLLLKAYPHCNAMNCERLSSGAIGPTQPTQH